MKKIALFFFLVGGLLLTSCQKETPSTSIKVNPSILGPIELEVFNIPSEIHHTLSEANDSVTLNITAPTIVNLVQGRTSNYVYVQSGDNLQLDTLPNSNGILGVASNASKENDYLVEFDKIAETQSEDYFLPTIAKQEVDSFLLSIEQKFEPLAELINALSKDNTVNQSFKSALQLRYLANKGNDLMAYSSMYNYYNQKEPELPTDFYAELEAIDFANPNLLLFEEGRRLGSSWTTKDVHYKDYDAVTEYFDACIKSVGEKYPNSLLRDYCLYKNTADNINFGEGIDGAEKMVADFKATVTNKYLNAKLDETLEPWLNLKAGLEAPNFVANTVEDAKVSLTDLKGKKVYIDVWATWCGPCIREIPALKELEADLHDENIEFVSVSIDQAKDKEKWIKFITDKELKGVQLMANGAWRSDIATAYNIKGIPRFLLIDETGKIISANAPRPSAPDIKDVLLNKGVKG